MKKIVSLLLTISLLVIIAVPVMAENGSKQILIATSGSESSDEAHAWGVLMDYVTEHTNGEITFKVFYNSSFCAQKEETEYLEDGDIDLHANLVAQNPERAIYRQPFGNAVGEDNANALFNAVVFENEETAALIQGEAAERNSIILGAWNSGANMFFAKKPISSFEDLRGTQYGADMGLAAIRAMGISSQYVTVVDTYESLSRGVIDSSSLPVAGVAVFKVWEVAPYGLYMDAAAPSHHIEMNMDTWNSLTEEEQEIFKEAVKLSEEDYLASLKAIEESVLESFEEVYYLTDEETVEFLKHFYQEQYNGYRDMAEAAGKLEGFRTVMKAVTDFVGVEIEMN